MIGHGEEELKVGERWAAGVEELAQGLEEVSRGKEVRVGQIIGIIRLEDIEIRIRKVSLSSRFYRETPASTAAGPSKTFTINGWEGITPLNKREQ